MREKEAAKSDWKQKILKGIEKTGETIKGHANSVSNQIRQFWKKMKRGSSKKSSKADKQEL